MWAIGFVGLTALSLQSAVPAESLLLDPSVVGGGLWYAGLVTSLTVLGWSVATVSLGFAAFACRVSGRTSASHATGAVAFIVGVLLLDDLFQLHTAVGPQLFGGSKWALVSLEGAALAAWAVAWRREITRTRWELLVASAIGFAGSLGVDRFPLADDRWSLIVEDGAKVLGVLALATWSVSTAADLIRSGLTRSDAARSGMRAETPAEQGPDGLEAVGVADLLAVSVRTTVVDDR